MDSQFPGTLGLDPMPPPLCTHLPRMGPIGSNPRPRPPNALGNSRASGGGGRLQAPRAALPLALRGLPSYFHFPFLRSLALTVCGKAQTSCFAHWYLPALLAVSQEPSPGSPWTRKGAGTDSNLSIQVGFLLGCFIHFWRLAFTVNVLAAAAV